LKFHSEKKTEKTTFRNKRTYPEMNAIVNILRREVIETAETVVIKIGTHVLARSDHAVNIDRLQHLAEQIHKVREAGKKVVVVSSGAVGIGLSLLNLNSRPDDLPHLQAAAACGQAHLIGLYDESLRKHGYHAAQILLTANDFRTRNRYLNVRNTLHMLFEYGVVPIINENDTVSVDEIKFGDNDHLAAMVTNLLKNPLLIILSVVDGLYDGDPNSPTSKRIPVVEEWSDDLLTFTVEEKSTLGSGGMRSKLKAVQIATAVGENVIVTDGTQPGVIERVLQGEDCGTLFLAKGASVPAWKRWIGFTIPPTGCFHLDEGACHAILHSGRSLLAIGITRVAGEFSKGEVVSMVNTDGLEIARGLTNYNSEDACKIASHRTEEIPILLGSMPYTEVVHRDNLVITN